MADYVYILEGGFTGVLFGVFADLESAKLYAWHNITRSSGRWIYEGAIDGIEGLWSNDFPVTMCITKRPVLTVSEASHD